MPRNYGHGAHGDQFFFDPCVVFQFLRDPDPALLIKFALCRVGAEMPDERAHMGIGLRQLRDLFHLLLPVFRRVNVQTAVKPFGEAASGA